MFGLLVGLMLMVCGMFIIPFTLVAIVPISVGGVMFGISSGMKTGRR